MSDKRVHVSHLSIGHIAQETIVRMCDGSILDGLARVEVEPIEPGGKVMVTLTLHLLPFDIDD